MLYNQLCQRSGQLTVTAWLHRGLDVADALDGDTVLVISVDVLVLKFTDFVEQDTELIRYVRDILVSGLTPDGKLLLQRRGVSTTVAGQLV